MSSDCVLTVTNLSKVYHVYENPHDRLKQALFPKLQRFFRVKEQRYCRDFWALRDISFSVKKGETFGIIGKNGSGKSTLLQLICGTLAPTAGAVDVSGRIAALLELGAGFNPEFTGIENIYMNGAILGLSQSEIDSRLQSIIDFADIGDFVNQPVKVYSSGMYVRLAFSVAINVDPDILIVDEALSVGDIAFQNKCKLKLKELRARGTTLLFVSHDLSTLQTICDRVAWIKGGELVTIGDAVSVCQEYFVDATGQEGGSSTPLTIIPQKDTGMARFLAATIEGGEGDSHAFMVGDPIRFRFSVAVTADIGKCAISLAIFRSDGDWSIGQTSRESGVFWPERKAGESFEGKIVLPRNCLAPGDYRVALGAHSDDLTICYALTELNLIFSVRSDYPTWGKFIHPCQWVQ